MSSLRPSSPDYTPPCTMCDQDATAVIARPSGEAHPCCASCSTTTLDQHEGAREYGIETYYIHGGDHAKPYAPDGSNDFDIYDPASENISWLAAKNDITAGSSVDLEEMR